jgi:hypothetical protein
LPDVGAQRDGSGRKETLVVSRLDVVNALQQFFEVRSGAGCRIIVARKVTDSFQATGNVQKRAVKGFIPVPWQPDFGEGRIERRAMAVTFGIGQGTVDIENKCAQCHDEKVARQFRRCKD